MQPVAVQLAPAHMEPPHFPTPVPCPRALSPSLTSLLEVAWRGPVKPCAQSADVLCAVPPTPAAGEGERHIATTLQYHPATTTLQATTTSPRICSCCASACALPASQTGAPSPFLLPLTQPRQCRGCLLAHSLALLHCDVRILRRRILCERQVALAAAAKGLARRLRSPA